MQALELAAAAAGQFEQGLELALLVALWLGLRFVHCGSLGFPRGAFLAWFLLGAQLVERQAQVLHLSLELAQREQDLIELVVGRRFGRGSRGRGRCRIRFAREQRAAHRVTQMNEEIFVLDHGIHVGQERSLPLLLLGEPALDQRRVVVRFVVSHAV